MNEYRSEYLRRQIMQQQATKTAAAKREKARNSRRANVLLIGTALMALLLLAIVPMRFRAIADDNSEPELKYLSSHANAGVIEAPTLMDARLSTTTQDPVSELAGSIMTTDDANLLPAGESFGVALTTISPSDATQRHITSWDDYMASDLTAKKDSCTQQDTLPLYKPTATESLYYVALLDASHVTGDAALIDVQVLKDGSPVQAGDGVIYDGDTGILYVPQELLRSGVLSVNALRAADLPQGETADTSEEIEEAEEAVEEGAEEAVEEARDEDLVTDGTDATLNTLAASPGTNSSLVQSSIPVTAYNPTIKTVLDSGHYQLATHDTAAMGMGIELQQVFDYGVFLTHPAYPSVEFHSIDDFLVFGNGGLDELTASTSTDGCSATYTVMIAPLRAALDSGFELVAVRNGMLYEVKTVADAYTAGFMFLYYDRHVPSFDAPDEVTALDEQSESPSLTPQSLPMELSSIDLFQLTWSVPSNPLFDNPVPVQTKAPALVEESASFTNYYSTNPSVASVDSGGMVTTHTAGEAQIWAESQYGNVNENERADMQAGEQTLLVTVTVTNATERKSASITVPNTSLQVVAGKTSSIGATKTSDAPIKYASSDTSVATVSASGVVTGKKQGNATITITTAQTNAYKPARATVSVRVTRRNASITVSNASMRIVAGKTGSIGATTTSDAPIQYTSSNTNIATVSASGVVTGKSQGSATISVATVQSDCCNAACQTVQIAVLGNVAGAKVSAPSITYDGKAHNGAITVTLSGKTLKPSTDYTLAITNSAGTTVTAIQDAGDYTIVARGKGNYTGTTKNKPVVMTVAKAANTAQVTVTKTKVAVKYASVKKKAQTVSNLTGKSIKGTVKCTNVSTDAVAKKFKVSTKGIVTVPKGTKKGTYTIKIKVTAAGNANYKSYKKTVAYKIVVK